MNAGVICVQMVAVPKVRDQVTNWDVYVVKRMGPSTDPWGTPTLPTLTSTVRRDQWNSHLV